MYIPNKIYNLPLKQEKTAANGITKMIRCAHVYVSVSYHKEAAAQPYRSLAAGFSRTWHETSPFLPRNFILSLYF